jgi:hypothetical protein
LSKKITHSLLSFLHSICKRILLLWRRGEPETIKQTRRLPSEAALEAQLMALSMIAVSLTMHSCGMCYGMIRDRSLLGILRSGDGGVMEWLSEGVAI